MLVVLSSQGDECLGCIISRWANKMSREREKNAYSQTSRLEPPEELQLHRNHEKFLFLTVLSLFAQCKMHYWWLVTWLDLALRTPSEWHVQRKISSANNKYTTAPHSINHKPNRLIRRALSTTSTSSRSPLPTKKVAVPWAPLAARSVSLGWFDNSNGWVWAIQLRLIYQ
jgi:hypothetical protein